MRYFFPLWQPTTSKYPRLSNCASCSGDAGAYDYVMTLRQDADYFRSQNHKDTQIAYFNDYPLSPAVFWTIRVWGALAASILLLLRNRWATPVAVIALVSQLCLNLVTFGFTDRLQIFGPRRAMSERGYEATTL